MGGPSCTAVALGLDAQVLPERRLLQPISAKLRVGMGKKGSREWAAERAEEGVGRAGKLKAAPTCTWEAEAEG